MKSKLVSLLRFSFILLMAGCSTGSSKRDIEIQDSLETVRIADSLLNLELSLEDSLEWEIDTASSPAKR